MPEQSPPPRRSGTNGRGGHEHGRSQEHRPNRVAAGDPPADELSRADPLASDRSRRCSRRVHFLLLPVARLISMAAALHASAAQRA